MHQYGMGNREIDTDKFADAQGCQCDNIDNGTADDKRWKQIPSATVPGRA